MGTSSFGMSGVNAHMLLRASAAHPPAPSSPWGPLQRTRHFITPMPHRLMHSHQPADPLGCASFALNLRHASLAHFRDHSCGGQPMMPVTGWVEAAAGAAFLLQEQLPAAGLNGLASPTMYPLADATTMSDTRSMIQLSISPYDGSTLVNSASTGSSCHLSARLCKLGAINGFTAASAAKPGQQHETQLLSPASQALLSQQRSSRAAPDPARASTGMTGELPFIMHDAYHTAPAASSAATVLLVIAASGDSAVGPAVLSAATACLVTQKKEPKATSSMMLGASQVSIQMSHAGVSRLPYNASSSTPWLVLSGMVFVHPSGAPGVGTMGLSNPSKALQAIYSITWHAAEPSSGDLSFPDGIFNRMAISLGSRRAQRGVMQAHTGRGSQGLGNYPAQSATLAAAHFLEFLQQHRKLPAQALSIIQTSLTHQIPVGFHGATDLSPASVQGVIRCFPYELPQMTVAVHQTDPHTHATATQSSLRIVPATKATSSSIMGDAFGRATQQGLTSLPHMAYNAAASWESPHSPLDLSSSGPMHTHAPIGRGLPALPGAQSGVMVTGGLSGLGLMSAEWVLQSGTIHAVLLGRSGRMAGLVEASAVSRSMHFVQAMRCDVAVCTEGHAAAAAGASGGWKLGGVLHAAGLQVRLSMVSLEQGVLCSRVVLSMQVLL